MIDVEMENWKRWKALEEAAVEYGNIFSLGGKASDLAEAKAKLLKTADDVGTKTYNVSETLIKELQTVIDLQDRTLKYNGEFARGVEKVNLKFKQDFENEKVKHAREIKKLKKDNNRLRKCPREWPSTALWMLEKTIHKGTGIGTDLPDMKVNVKKPDVKPPKLSKGAYVAPPNALKPKPNHRNNEL